MNKNIFIVLHDFTPVGDSGLNYALYLSSKITCEIKVVHILNDKSELKAATAKLEQIINDSRKSSYVTITPIIKVGNFFNDIGKVIMEEKSQLVIMGTHGMKGMQKLFGSHAMKVITSTSIPFVVIQQETEAKQLKKILIPIDLSKESLQIVNNAGDIAKIFNAKVTIAYEKQGDTMRENQMKNRIHIVKRKIIENGVSCDLVRFESNDPYHKKVIDYSVQNEFDMIAIAYHSVSLLPQFEKYAQTLITNEPKIPCMIINSQEATFSFF